MAILNVNPTRMELQKLKNKLRVAAKGHKLLKDKVDEMKRQLLSLIKQNKTLQAQVDQGIGLAVKSFLFARIRMTSQEIESACMLPLITHQITAATAGIMGLQVPKLKIDISSFIPSLLSNQTQSNIDKTAPNLNNSNSNKNISVPMFPINQPQLDTSINILQNQLPNIVRLAELKKTCTMLENEIERNRRRINALEFIIIPQIRETIKYITIKLGENERQNTVRVMKATKK